MSWFSTAAWLLKRRLRHHWPLWVLAGVGMLAVSTFLSISDPYTRALAEGGVHHTLANTKPEVRNTRVIVEQKPIGPKDYQRTQGIVESNIDSRLGWAIADTKRFGQSQHMNMVGSQDAVPEAGGGAGQPDVAADIRAVPHDKSRD
ncbi:MAG: hypothetical protein FJ320_10725 [SAR202 cluster bacterium]|nr:hypothetical protein [SAR202 cluster bacterium]